MKHLSAEEKNLLLKLYMSRLVEEFPYPDYEFFEKNRIDIGKEEPKTSQIRALGQVALNAQNVDMIINEIVDKAMTATLPERRSVKVINTLVIPAHRKELPLWQFLAHSLIHIRDQSGFLKDWLINRQLVQLNNGLDSKDFPKISEGEFTLLEEDRLALARKFIDHFINWTLKARIKDVSESYG